tara:strand:- start:827 stop:1048 length:222 start_codon:yes stop_codon:yes gene_type:complete
LKSNRATKHQEIYIRTKNGLKLVLPKKITSDIGFQLMFGYREDYKFEHEKKQKNANKYFTKTYLNIKDFKLYI